MHRSRVNTELNLLNNNSTSVFYRYVNSKLNASRGSTPLRNGANLFTNYADNACTFNNLFSFIFSPLNLAPPLINLESAHTSDEVDFSPATVFATLCKAKYTLSAGSDIVPSVLWTKLAPVLTFPISVFYVIF